MEILTDVSREFKAKFSGKCPVTGYRINAGVTRVRMVTAEQVVTL